ncbi:ribonuclease MRP protein subunit POP4 isoform X1 [Coffea arabica]|uniref:Ribonuclease MRP protein subunit POP4 isoform X1 n=1 Tax=Coffea arabica TaxID=13443 RepID=A0A6P6VAM4_COFAR|nr:ribonuclease P protein subunit p29-like isoform X1 [Coffea arabica]XP_027100003.1 ribonuclease P protein subunit p29-like isoform X1 [Coffea arabica]XP_027100004.1 ribonuclease P protein subunit p29-like isoform X1 [Coffea arabica]XP_027100005.1 ribonuclease P protein subunit p29-like isoform X1 [Coffea arabica]XP_027100007.1 ribonuclease P protein subunit p29-like isoform X1 [Coffea arabica]
MASNTSLDERRKRTLDALQRRFAQEEAEHELQQKKSKKRVQEGKDKIPSGISHPSTDASAIAAPSSLSAKKGSISFSSHTSKEEASDPAYFGLSNSVQENLLRDGDEISDKRSIVDYLLHDLFQHGDAADKYMQGSKSIKIDNWILLDNFVQKSGTAAAARVRALQTHSRRSKRHMSLKQHKKCGSFHLPQQLRNFELFKPMHEMWKSYISQLLKHVGKNQLAQCLLNADLHGSVILVVECKIEALHGVHGIMICETAETFGIITEDNKFQVVPKKLSVFMLQADSWKITLHGDKLTSRPLVP